MADAVAFTIAEPADEPVFPDGHFGKQDAPTFFLGQRQSRFDIRDKEIHQDAADRRLIAFAFNQSAGCPIGLIGHREKGHAAGAHLLHFQLRIEDVLVEGLGPLHLLDGNLKPSDRIRRLLHLAYSFRVVDYRTSHTLPDRGQSSIRNFP